MKHFRTETAKFIQEYCKLLKKISLTNFMHDITFGKGEITMLVSDANILDFYEKNQIPTLCTDDSGRVLDSGVYLNKLLQNNYQECAILIPHMQKVGKKFGQYYGKNSLSIVVREQDCQHLYSLFFDLDEKDFLHWIINNGELLKEIINNYNRQAKDIILAAKAEENRIVLPNYRDIHFSLEVQNEIPRLSLIHKHLHIPIHLSEQQSKCFLLLMQGKSAKQIAKEMKLSYRTIEHYLEKIRRLLGCTSSKDLIISYGDQII